jgi:hypothetical protein
MAAGRPLLVSEADGLKDHAALGARPVADLSVEAWAKALRDLAALPDRTGAEVARAQVALSEQRFAESWAALIADLT